MNQQQLHFLADAHSHIADAGEHVRMAENILFRLSKDETVEARELEAFRALAAEVKYYVDRWPKQAGEHLKRLAALCPEGREWTPET